MKLCLYLCEYIHVYTYMCTHACVYVYLQFCAYSREMGRKNSEEIEVEGKKEGQKW